MLESKCDSKGRIYLQQKLRAIYGDSFVVVERRDGIVLLPVPDDPAKDLASLGQSLKGESIQKIRKRARRRAKEEAVP